jgi:hypothetical protein
MSEEQNDTRKCHFRRFVAKNGEKAKQIGDY